MYASVPEISVSERAHMRCDAVLVKNSQHNIVGGTYYDIFFIYGKHVYVKH